ncbi:hypothetical protein CK203_004041 [Vitis vinifera]|uniref:Ubiquitin-like protease family profile domain-containing protein n=1 Tax=Vitis vinifera TaxID=29760 RepID=A0A438KAE6_VITVI|nr:hypothetical protein CK203_004041 [Vitis vinifera]
MHLHVLHVELQVEEGGKFDGKMRHPSDSPSWKVIDHRWPDFAAEPRNLRLAIFKQMTLNPHSSFEQSVKDILLVQSVDRETYSHRLKHGRKNSFTREDKKDGLNSRLDLMDMGLRCELAPRNLVSMEDLKLYGLKSHDYHTLMQQLLLVVDVSTLDQLQNELVVTLCLLEKYFPPSFFDIMIHLTVHLVREVRLCGPVYFRWMYPFERFMKVLKGYVRTVTTLKVALVECYIAEEAIEFCTEYLSNVDAIGVPSSTNVDHKVGAPIPGGHITEVDCNLLLQAHHYVLENTTIIQPYIEEHMKWLKLNNPRQSKRQKWLQEEHMRTFTHWLRKKVEVAIADKEPISETLRWMAHGPTHYVAKYHGYVINELPRIRIQYLVSYVSMVLLLRYGILIIPCLGFQFSNAIGLIIRSGIKVDEFGLTLVDFTKMAHKSNPFILASQAKQVFYVQDQLDPRWRIFCAPNKLLRCIARTMVPIRYNTWRDVPEQLKDKLWDSIEDELMKESQDSGISYSGSNDILSQALGTPEYTGRVRAKGKHYTPGRYFNSMSERVIGVATPQSDGSHKGKRQKTTENDLKIGENPQDINNFDALVGLMLNEGKAQGTYRKKLSDARLTERFAFINPALVSKAGMGETTKENRSRLIANRLMHAKRADYILIPYNLDFHWVLVALDMRTMTAYYLDPMQKQPCDDLKEIVNMHYEFIHQRNKDHQRESQHG